MSTTATAKSKSLSTSRPSSAVAAAAKKAEEERLAAEAEAARVAEEERLALEKKQAEEEAAKKAEEERLALEKQQVEAQPDCTRSEIICQTSTTAAMNGIWETVVTTFHGDSSGTQATAAASFNYREPGVTHLRMGGQVTLQRMNGTAQFRILLEGNYADGSDAHGSVQLPLNANWSLDCQPAHTDNGNVRRALLVALTFNYGGAATGVIQMSMTFPLGRGNSRRAKLFYQSLIFADQCRRSLLD